MNTGKTYNLPVTGIEDRIANLINSLKVGVLLQGSETEVLYNNQAALEMLGLTEDELYERSPLPPSWNVIRESGQAFPHHEHPVQVAFRTKNPVENVIMGVYRPVSKDRIWLMVNANPVIGEGGEVKEVICSFSDITEHKDSEKKLHWLYRDLEMRAIELAASNADMERFVHVATHDLQEPLRLITGFLQLLEKKFENHLDGQAKEYIKYAVEGSARMKKLIMDLLEYSKFSNSREGFVETDMNDVLKKVAADFAPQLEALDAELLVDDLPVIFSDAALIVQLFENLIGNALKYRADRPLIIRVKCKEMPEKYIFSVSDNGIGIEPGYSEKIFNLFQRLHTNETYEGTGVGLAICRKIIRLHQGTIGVSAEPGSGSSFWFTIPKLKTPINEEL